MHASAYIALVFVPAFLVLVIHHQTIELANVLVRLFAGIVFAGGIRRVGGFACCTVFPQLFLFFVSQ
ncbi:hypothetical protein Barb7_02199 [Bacteroidales bacterium Barb7]|nr:hypothetical protein Barb7_02199 [Bacteroidales bacterium Barb7]